MGEQPRIAVVGAGFWGKNIVRNVAELGALGAICDPDESRAGPLAEAYGVEAAGLESVLADESISGVMIAAPAVLHAELAAKCLAAGKDVFVEKPLALRVSDAQDLVDQAAQARQILMVGHLLQYHAAYQAMKRLVFSGALGRVHYAYSNRLNFGRIRREEDSLWSFAPHDISMILGLMGAEPVDVQAVSRQYLHPTVSDVTTTHMTFPDGQAAHVFVSWLHPFKEQKLVVVGDKAMATFDDSEDWGRKLVVYRHEVSWEDGVPTAVKADGEPVELVPSEPLRAECAQFLESIRTRNPPPTDGAEGLRVLRVLERASSETSRQAARTSAPAPDYEVHPTAVIDDGVTIGSGTRIWHFVHLLAGTRIGTDCVLGQNVMVGPNVVVGDRCKIQNNVSLYEGVELADDVFLGPSCVFTNVLNPRAAVERKSEFRPTRLARGVSVGANATIICGTTLGEYAFVGAGSVVTRDVPAYALVVGNPARQAGWMSRAGERLGPDLVCPRTGERYEHPTPTTLRIAE